MIETSYSLLDWSGLILDKANRMPLLACSKPYRVPGRSLQFVGCGRCPNCISKRMCIWGNRLWMESQCHVHSAFLTLTYTNELCRSDCDYDDTRLFLYRLREYLSDKEVFEDLPNCPFRRCNVPPLRYYLTGDYSQRKFRPHYHAAVFGISNRMYVLVDDKYLPMQEVVQSLWLHGTVDLGDLSKGGARYVIGYCTKKMLHASDPAMRGRSPMKAFMSRAEALGSGFMLNVVTALREKGSGAWNEFQSSGDLAQPYFKQAGKKVYYGRQMLSAARDFGGISDVVLEARKVNNADLGTASNMSWILDVEPHLIQKLGNPSRSDPGDYETVSGIARKACDLIQANAAQVWSTRVQRARAKGQPL